MDAARFLASPAGWAAVAEFSATGGSLADLARLRERYEPSVAAAISAQAELQVRAVAKFGVTSGLLFTKDGLEQASRPAVSNWRAQWFVESGVSRVIDVGCGLGFDSRAFVAAGLAVTAIERDPVTAVFAAHNAPGAEVAVGDAEELLEQVLASYSGERLGIFLDPARRTERGRTWAVDQLSPSWDFVRETLAQDALVNVKLGPGFPYQLLPKGLDATWISDGGDVVETSLWNQEGDRRALLLPSGDAILAGPPPPVHDLGEWIYEPDGAVLRAGAVGTLAARHGWGAVAEGIGYLTGTAAKTPFATGFRVLEVLPFKESRLQAWVKSSGTGVLEIKKRGLDFDPAALRRRLRPRGSAAATLLCTPTTDGPRAVVVERES